MINCVGGLFIDMLKAFMAIIFFKSGLNFNRFLWMTLDFDKKLLENDKNVDKFSWGLESKYKCFEVEEFSPRGSLRVSSRIIGR